MKLRNYNIYKNSHISQRKISVENYRSFFMILFFFEITRYNPKIELKQKAHELPFIATKCDLNFTQLIVGHSKEHSHSLYTRIRNIRTIVQCTMDTVESLMPTENR